LGRAVKVLVVLVVLAVVIGGVVYYFLSRVGLSGVVNITGVELWVDPERVTKSSTPDQCILFITSPSTPCTPALFLRSGRRLA